MKISGEGILKYIPQRFPIVMIDTLCEASEKKIICNFTIEENNIFLEQGYFNESGLVENIAQTAAAGIGYKQVSSNSPVNLGYIAAIKSLSIYSLPKVKSVLQTTIELVNEVIDISIVKAEIICKDQKIAECEMRIFTKPL